MFQDKVQRVSLSLELLKGEFTSLQNNFMSELVGKL
jgi:hypothetical protein